MLLALAVFVAIGFLPLFDCPHSEWCDLIIRLKGEVAKITGEAPEPYLVCPHCRDQGRVTLARKLLGPPRRD